MPKHSPLEIEVLRSPYQDEVVRGYDYDILVSGRQTKGNARIVFNPVRALKQHLLKRVYVQLIAHKLKPTDTFAVLYYFYPNGKRPTEEKMRQGVGSYALKEILADCREEGIRALYVTTKSPSLLSFLEKKKFVCADDELARYLSNNRIYYRILRQRKDVTQT